MAVQTRLGVSGFARPPYGSFAGKTAAPDTFPRPDGIGPFTRLGVSGFARTPYGSFAGKAETVVEPPTETPAEFAFYGGFPESSIQAPRRDTGRHRRDDDTLLAAAALLLAARRRV